MTSVFAALGIVVAVYAALVAVMYLNQRSLMYPGARGVPPSPAEAGTPALSVVTYATADGLELTGWFHAAAPGRPTIVYFQGNAGHIAERAFKSTPWVREGFGVLYGGYRGYGGNPGAPSEAGLALDAEAALAFAARNGAPANDIVLYGESLGTGVATALAHHQAQTGKPVRGLILESPFTSMVDAAAHHYPWLPVRTLVKDRFDTIGRIAGIGAAVLVLHGTADRVVPFSQGEAVFAAARDPKSKAWFEGGGHTDLDDFGAGAVISAFLDGVTEPAENGGTPRSD